MKIYRLGRGGDVSRKVHAFAAACGVCERMRRWICRGDPELESVLRVELFERFYRLQEGIGVHDEFLLQTQPGRLLRPCAPWPPAPARRA